MHKVSLVGSRVVLAHELHYVTVSKRMSATENNTLVICVFDRINRRIKGDSRITIIIKIGLSNDIKTIVFSIRGHQKT